MIANTTRILNISLSKPFELEKGGDLSSIDVAYESYGKLNEKKDNAILICHPLTMDAHVSNNGDTSVEAGWWNFLVGPGQYIDTKKYFVICFNILGGCKGTTGPTSINLETGKHFGKNFPEVTMLDIVKVQKLALEQLEIEHLYAVIGGSLGGMQVLEWSVRYPEQIRKCIAIATGANLSTQGLAFDIVGRQCVMEDPDWEGGDYEVNTEKAFTGLALARMIGHITYISKNMMDKKFGRKLQKGWKDAGFNTAFAVESFLKYQSEKFIKRFDPNAYLYLSKVMDSYDLCQGYNSLAESLARSRCEYLIISFSSDWLFPPENSVDLVWALSNQGKRATYTNIETDLGHDAFLIDEPEIEMMMKLVEQFLEADHV